MSLFRDHYSGSHNVFETNVCELDEHDDAIEQPNDIFVQLKPHQRTLIKKCINIENEPIYVDRHKIQTNVGIIGDRVGSGKSYCCLSIIMLNNIVNKETILVRSFGENNITFYMHDAKKTIKTNLIVVPHNLVVQWNDYILNFSDKLQCKIIAREKTLRFLEEDNFSLENFDVVVVTSTLYNKLAKYIATKRYKLQRIFFDEVDNLWIPATQSIESKFIWFVSASYGNILYPRGFTQIDQSTNKRIYYANGIRNDGFIKRILLDLYIHISRDVMKLLIVKNSESYINSSVNFPRINTNIVKCKTPYSVLVLNGIVDKNIIKSLNAGDVDAALQYISPSHKGSENNIVSLLIEKYETIIKNFNTEIEYHANLIVDSESEREVDIERIRTKISEYSQKILMIRDRIKRQSCCPICFDDMKTRAFTKCCENSFCFECITKWINTRIAHCPISRCPLCKQVLTTKDLYVVQENQPEISNDIIDIDMEWEENTNENFDKYKNAEIIVRNLSASSKTLIFSSNDSSLSGLEHVLRAHGKKFSRIVGNGAQINSIVQRYKNGDTDVLLVNSRDYGCGLNLENTTDIILFHKFDTQLEQQVVGRAYRIGRTLPLNVHYLLYENEIPNST